MADNARKALVTSLKTLYDSGKYTDLLITCGSDTYKVHKSVVCNRSGFFERAERFPVSAEKDSETKGIDLPEDEPLVVKLMIQYLYEGEYDPKLPDGGCMDMVKASLPVSPVTTPKRKGGGFGGYSYDFPHSCSGFGGCKGHLCPHHTCGNQCGMNCRDFTCLHCAPGSAPAPALTHPPAQGGASQLLLHAKLYEIADKYDVHGLKELAREKFLRACTQFWSSELFAPAAHYAFSTTPEKDKGLRDVISNIISQHMTLLNKPAVEALLTEFNGLALGVLKMRATDLGWTKDA